MSRWGIYRNGGRFPEKRSHRGGIKKVLLLFLPRVHPYHYYLYRVQNRAQSTEQRLKRYIIQGFMIGERLTTNQTGLSFDDSEHLGK